VLSKSSCPFGTQIFALPLGMASSGTYLALNEKCALSLSSPGTL